MNQRITYEGHDCMLYVSKETARALEPALVHECWMVDPDWYCSDWHPTGETTLRQVKRSVLAVWRRRSMSNGGCLRC